MLGFEKEFYVEVIHFDIFKRITSIKRKDFDQKVAMNEFNSIIKSYKTKPDSPILVCVRRTKDNDLIKSELLNYYKKKGENKSATLRKLRQEQELDEASNLLRFNESFIK